MTRSLRAGAVLVTLYVAVAAATALWAPGRLRPLFDGFGSHPGEYNWVNPPQEFADGNRRPDSFEGIVRLDASGSQDASMGPGDGQIALDLQPGSLAANPPDTEATVRLSPVDAGTLGPLPAGLRPEGNAYKVEIEYDSGPKVVTLDKEARIGLISAAPADTLLYSAEGSAWKALAGEPLPTGNGITGPAAATGYYLAASENAPRAAAASSRSGAPILVIVAALAVPAALAVLLFTRREPTPTSGKRTRSGLGKPGTRTRGKPTAEGRTGTTRARAKRAGPPERPNRQGAGAKKH